ncbi:MAG: periplasmic heavy metal sensor [Deltaproteobacteria bacterium]|nr:periplasmic heavy metal sensor [Deltaproteobacteria bacterium]MBW2344191.1 periplasmic heavy metal sensor [Deltaproteobacteria bacterium]
MKRLAIVLGSLMLVAAIAYPVFAWGPGWGRGHHMMGPWGGGPGYPGQYGSGYGNLTREQQSKLDALDKKFYDETNNLRNEMWAKSTELNALLNTPNPDEAKAKALQKEITELRNKLAEKGLAYRLEARKIAPDAGPGRGYGSGPGRGHGPGMMGYGPGPGGHGPGPGYCWN